MDVDNNPIMPTQLAVSGIPTLMLFKGGQIVEAVVGAVDKEHLRKMLEPHLK
jgi:thioredoxin 1